MGTAEANRDTKYPGPGNCERVEARSPKPRLVTPAVIAVAVVLLTLPVFGLWEAFGQNKNSPNTRTKRIQKTEFKVVPVQFNDYKTTPQWRRILVTNGNNEALARSAFHELLLNTLAKDGWELVQITKEDKKNAVFYLKRSLAPK
ncbi:MAG: hypothetical protein P1V97_16940 [Planctomycetota bacterium]|nr:hypothetical protein [Planctomycetota bacterium]